jgi:hypothetical protein
MILKIKDICVDEIDDYTAGAFMEAFDKLIAYSDDNTLKKYNHGGYTYR